MSTTSIDLDRLLKLRVVVAHFGETQGASWWNTESQLRRPGKDPVLKRGFLRTHHFAQARSVFAVADHACTKTFAHPKCVTLWRLTEAMEEAFEIQWEHWLDRAQDWSEFFTRVEGLASENLIENLQVFSLVSDRDVAAFNRLRPSPDGRRLELAGEFAESESDISLLALGFAHGKKTKLVVPYARRRLL